MVVGGWWLVVVVVGYSEWLVVVRADGEGHG